MMIMMTVMMMPQWPPRRRVGGASKSLLSLRSFAKFREAVLASGPELQHHQNRSTSMRSRSCRCLVQVLLCVASLLTLIPATHGFTLASSARQCAVRTRETRANNLIQLGAASPTQAPSEASEVEKSRTRSFSLSPEEVKPIFRLGKGDKEKVVNAFGLWCLAVSLITGPMWAAAMSVLNLVYRVHGDAWDPHRSIYDATGKVWARSWLTLTNSMPTFSGHVEQIGEGSTGPCLFVANHASWLDIPILCTVLHPVFKFIAKGELRGVPCIGQQLAGGHHILIDREDRKSQIRTFKDGIRWLNRGVPLMAFPEGKRSMDGRLMEFKGGLFSMAAKTKCPIVPITISHAHAVMPCNALFPVQAGRGRLHVHVHEPIDAVGRSEEELVELVRRAFLSTLPLEQHPLADEVQIIVGDDQPHQSLDRRETHHSVSLTGSSEVASPPVVQVEISLSKSPLPRTEEGTAEVVELAST